MTLMTHTFMLLAFQPLAAALLIGLPTTVTRLPCHARTASLQMCASQCGNAGAEGREIVEAFVAATERGDAAAATELCADDLLYKTHRATTESLAAAQERLHTKVPAPSKVTKELHEESEGKFVREIVVKPVPFITVAIRQEFDVECPATEGAEEECPIEDCRLSRAEFIKQ